MTITGKLVHLDSHDGTGRVQTESGLRLFFAKRSIIDVMRGYVGRHIRLYLDPQKRVTQWQTA